MPAFRTAINANGIPALGFCPTLGSSAPSSPADGQQWYDTANKILKTWDSATSAWVWQSAMVLAGTTQYPGTDGTSNQAGTSAAAARSDHSHNVGLDATAAHIAGLGTQAAGAVGAPCDSGHVHPATVAGNLTIGGDGLDLNAAGAAVNIGETVSSTATVTVASLTVPGGEPQDNVVYEIDIFGAYGTASSGTNNLTFTVNWGATGLGSNAFTMPNSINVSAPARWRFKASICFTSATLCYSSLRLELAPLNTVTAASVYLWGANPSTGTTVTTSSAQALALTMAWSVNSASNGFYITGGRIWKAA